MLTAKKTKYYKGQALAIVMIILIVGVVIALSVYSRSLRNKERISKERMSQEATDYVDSILEVVNTLDREDLTRRISEVDPAVCPDWENSGVCCIQNSVDSQSEINDFLGVSLGLDEFEYSDAESSSAELCFDERNEISEPRGIEKDQTYTIYFQVEDLDCEYDLAFSTPNSSSAGVILNKVYADFDASGDMFEFKRHHPDDMVSIDISNSGGEFADWDIHGSNTSIDLEGINSDHSGSGDYVPVMLRIRALGDDVNFTITEASGSENKCDNVLEYRVTATANNSGNEQSSYYYMPLEGTFPSIFDYVLFNSEGDLEFDI